jgi:outer membrane receptor protein involved in Fe transport
VSGVVNLVLKDRDEPEGVHAQIARHGVRYAAGVYNLFNWQYALPAVPYAANVMPQNGRSFIFSLTATR